MDQQDQTLDFSAYELDDIATLTVQDASGFEDMLYNGLPVTIDIYGPGSAQAVKMLHASGRKAALRTTALIRGKVSQKAGEEADEERVDKLVAITKAINNFPYPGGPRGVYANPKLVYIADQVDTFFNDKSNFKRASTPS